ncbi:S4 domain-containing protein YaaA [Xylocopilactobacillus apicola]|nr:S4 domain-containing protein YaaA [Xylocopilactobacillus apicola]
MIRREVENVEQVKLKSEFMKLQDLLKIVGIIGTGGAAKGFLSEYEVLVNNERETRRGRKLRPGDIVSFGNNDFQLVASDETS